MNNNNKAAVKIMESIEKSSDPGTAAELTISVIRSFLMQIQQEKQARPDDLPERSQAIAV